MCINIVNCTEFFPDAPFKATIGGKCWKELREYLLWEEWSNKQKEDRKMTLAELISKAKEVDNMFSSSNIPLKLNGKDVDIRFDPIGSNDTEYVINVKMEQEDIDLEEEIQTWIPEHIKGGSKDRDAIIE